MKNLFLSLLGVAVFIIFVGLLTKTNQGEKTILSSLLKKTSQEENLKTIKIDDKEIKVRLADTDSLRRKGLSGTTKLADDEGMLFVFEQKGTFPGFWMKNMLMPIDIIWIVNDKILQIDKNILPEPTGTPDSKLKIYYPPKPIDYVLEMASGGADKNGFKIGNQIEIPFLSKE